MSDCNQTPLRIRDYPHQASVKVRSTQNESNKIKKQSKSDPDFYKTFMEVLDTFQRDQKNITVESAPPDSLYELKVGCLPIGVGACLSLVEQT